VRLVGKEHGFYSNMMSLAAPNGDTKVGGREAVIFFKKSGLPVDKLKHFWMIAAKTSNEYLTKDEFYVALRLIAYEQNGIAADENSINNNVDVALPRF
jgi:epidermal growth factor receptor substrate 15